MRTVVCDYFFLGFLPLLPFVLDVEQTAQSQPVIKKKKIAYPLKEDTTEPSFYLDMPKVPGIGCLSVC